jgi:general secretion pathway protein D
MNSRFILALLLAAATHAAEPAPAGTVRLALSDEDLPQALALYGKLAGVTVISSPGLPMTRITHETATPMTPVAAAAALESLLAVNGVALVPAGPGTVRAVPAARAANEAPEFITGEVASLPASQRVVTRMFRPSKVSVAQAETVLRDLSTPGSSKVQTLASAGTLLVTDSLTNIQRMDRILNLIEKESAVKTIELKAARGSDLAREFKSLQTGALRDRVGAEISVEPLGDGSRVLVTAPAARLEETIALVAELDKAPGSSVKTEVHLLKQADSADVAALVKEIATGGRAMPGAQKADANQFSQGFSVFPDKRSNSLVAVGLPSDQERLRELLRSLDSRLAQVRIEVVIAEVTLGDGEVSGLAALGITDAVGSSSFNMSTDSVPGASSPALTLRGTTGPRSLQAVLGIAAQNTRVKVLSTPTVVTSHASRAIVNVSQSQPIVTGSQSDLASATVSRSTVTYRDIGIKLEVTPRVGSDRSVQMQVSQLVENIVGTTTIDRNEQPIIGKREASSQVTVADGGVVALAGLRASTERKVESKVWLLGSIPLLGNLFTSNQNVSETRELVILLRPTVESGDNLAPSATRKDEASKSAQEALAPR